MIRLALVKGGIKCVVSVFFKKPPFLTTPLHWTGVVNLFNLNITAGYHITGRPERTRTSDQSVRSLLFDYNGLVNTVVVKPITNVVVDEQLNP